MKGELEIAVYYLSCRVGVSCSVGSQMCGSWYFPMFLLHEGSLTLMNIASFMFLALPCGSLCMMVKQSGLTGCPVVLLYWWMGDGGLRCSFTLSPNVLQDSNILFRAIYMGACEHVYYATFLQFVILVLRSHKECFDSICTFKMNLYSLVSACLFESFT